MQLTAGVTAVDGVDASAVWARARADLQTALPPSSFKLWVEPLNAVSSDGTTLYMSAPDEVRRWIERRYAARIVAALRRHQPQLNGIDFVTGSEHRDTSEDLRGDQASQRALGFTDFVIGSGNRFAHAAALAAAEMPGEAYNPLFLHGRPGVGKSHLLAAMASYMRRSRPALGVLLVTAERFTADFVSALRAGKPERFKQSYRSLGALLIDDVQFLEDKDRTAEELFHTFDALRARGGQIVLSSDRSPRELTRLAERLRDRFEWGLCAEVGEPDLRTRMLVLRRLADEQGSIVGADPTLRAIAARCSNLRQLEGALTRVVAFSSLMGTAATPELVADVLGTPAPRRDDRERPTVERVQEAVCAVLHLSRDELLSDRRTPDVVRARRLAIHLARERLSLSLGELARAFRRDRATILYSLRGVERELAPGSPTTLALARASEELDGSPPAGGEPVLSG